MTEIHENDEMAERDGEHSQIKWYKVLRERIHEETTFMRRYL